MATKKKPAHPRGHQHKVTTQSMMRRAAHHRKLQREHKAAVKTAATPASAAAHTGAAMANHDAALVLKAEIAELRSHP